MGLAPSGQHENTANLLYAEVPVPIYSHRLRDEKAFVRTGKTATEWPALIAGRREPPDTGSWEVNEARRADRD
jgi:hypothetical protein